MNIITAKFLCGPKVILKQDKNKKLLKLIDSEELLLKCSYAYFEVFCSPMSYTNSAVWQWYFFFLFQIVNDFIGHLVYIHVSHEDLIEAAKQIRSNVNGKSEFPSQVS